MWLLEVFEHGLLAKPILFCIFILCSLYLVESNRVEGEGLLTLKGRCLLYSVIQVLFTVFVLLEILLIGDWLC